MKSSFRTIEQIRSCESVQTADLKRDWTALFEQVRHWNAVCALAGDSVWELARNDGLFSQVPVLVKDNFVVRGMTATAGSMHMPVCVQQRDADCVARLREAGAVIVGKTTLSELSGFVSTRMPPGYSQRYGQTINSVFENRTPGGSSSGSASAVACGLVPLALGTETNGSIMIPAMRHHIIGFKPSHGSISTQGVIPISHHFDTVGVLANDCADVERFLCVCQDSQSEILPAGEMSIRRLGVVISSDSEKKKQINALERVARELAIEVEPVKLPEEYRGYKAVCSTDIRSDMTQWLEDYGDGTVPDFDSLVQRYRQGGHPFGFDRLEDASHFVGNDAHEQYEIALKERLRLRKQLEALFEKQSLDAVAMSEYAAHWAMIGWPQITVPWEKEGNILIAMPRGTDRGLLTLTNTLLQAKHGRI